MAASSWQEQELSLRDFLEIFGRHRRLLYAIPGTIVLLAVLYCLVSTPRYLATGTVQVEREGADGLSPDSLMGNQPGAGDALLADITLQTQAGILQSNQLGLRTIYALKLQDSRDFHSRLPHVAAPLGALFGKRKGAADPDAEKAAHEAALLKIFHKRLAVKPQPGTRLLNISYANSDPKLAAEVVNELVKGLVDYGYETRFNATEEASRTLSKQLADLRTRSEQMQAQLAQMQRETGIYSIGLTDPQGREQAYSVVLDQFQRAATTMNEAAQNRILKQAIYQAAQTGDAEMLSSLAGNSMSGGSQSSITNALATIQTLRAQESVQQAELDQVKVKFGPAYPHRQELESSIAGLEGSIAAETGRIRERAKNDFVVANQTYGDAAQTYGSLKGKADTVNNKAIAYMITRQEADESRTLYEDLLRRLKEAGVLQALRSNTVTLVDPAMAPSQPAQPNVPLILGGALIGGLVLGALAVLGLDVFDDRLHSANAAEGLGMPVLGLLPASGAGYRDGVHGVRSRLAVGEARHKAVLVTSATPGEGSRAFGLELAASFAETGRRAVLVEADLRHPALARSLGLSGKGGLSLLLSGAAKLEDALEAHPRIANLWILPAGPMPAAPTALLDSDAMRGEMTELRKRFDAVVIDGPAVLGGTADAGVLAGLADITVQVVKLQQVTRTALRRAHGLLAGYSSRPVGLVLLGIEGDSLAYRRFYGYRAGAERVEAYEAV